MCTNIELHKVFDLFFPTSVSRGFSFSSYKKGSSLPLHRATSNYVLSKTPSSQLPPISTPEPLLSQFCAVKISNALQNSDSKKTHFVCNEEIIFVGNRN